MRTNHFVKKYASNYTKNYLLWPKRSDILVILLLKTPAALGIPPTALTALAASADTLVLVPSCDLYGMKTDEVANA